ncbi:MAG: protein kinase [Thermoanaerobaculia bacterium]
MALAPGRKLGPYVVLAPIATGGMGVVYRCRDTKLDRDVALKVLPERVASNPLALARFESEAKAVAALSHPGIVAIHDFGRIDGVTFTVSELLDGETLRATLVRGALPVGRALDVASQVAEALAEAHAHGFVHRDLKPENIFLTRDGRAKILDFGLAVRSEPASGREAGSRVPTDPADAGPDRPPGTAAYMSPEHARGLSVDAPSDQFSLGVVLYEMLAGVRPFQGASSAETLSSILRDEPPSLSARVQGLPDPVRWIVDRCLAKRPEERYASTLDLARDLRSCRVRFGEGPLAQRRPANPLRARRWAAAGVALAFLLLAGIAGRWAASGRESSGYRALLAGRRFQRVTDRAMNAFSPTLCPSGDRVAFVRRLSPGDTDVFVQGIDGGRPIDVTGDNPGEDGEPAFSPNGTLLAFRSDRTGGGLFVVESLGGPARRVTTFGHDPAWLPDGRHLVFATAATTTPYGRLGTDSEIWSVDLATGATARVAGADAMQPAVSPHGTRVAFWTVRPGSTQRDIATVALEPDDPPEAPVLVTSDAAFDWSPFWSDDGRYICFASDRGGTMDLWRVRVDEQSGRPLAPPEPLPVPARSAGPFRGSPDGRSVVFQAGTSGFDLARVPLDASGLPAGRDETIVADSEGMGEPRLSPAGDLLAFSTWRGGEDLWIVGTDGRGLLRVTSGAFHDRSPSFSADGGSLYFHSDRSGKFEIWKVFLDGSGLAPVTSREGVQPFRALASPDGRFLALQSARTGAILLPAGLAPGADWPDPLPAPEEGVRFEVTSFSAEGRLVAGHGIARDETYRGTWLWDTEAKRFERLSLEGSCPQLVLGGQRAYFLRQTTLLEPARLAFLDAATRRWNDVLPRPGEPGVIAFAAAPDGSALYVVRERSRTDVWLMRFR